MFLLGETLFIYLFAYIVRALQKGDEKCGSVNNLPLFHHISGSPFHKGDNNKKKQGTQYEKQLSVREDGFIE